MRRTIITIAALVAFGGFAEAHPRHHYTHHHRGNTYSHHHHHHHHLRFGGRHQHRHHASRSEHQHSAMDANAAQSWFGAPAPEYPQARSGRSTSRPSQAWSHTSPSAASSAAGRIVRASWYGGGEKLSSRTA